MSPCWASTLRRIKTGVIVSELSSLSQAALNAAPLIKPLCFKLLGNRCFWYRYRRGAFVMRCFFKSPSGLSVIWKSISARPKSYFCYESTSWNSHKNCLRLNTSCDESGHYLKLNFWRKEWNLGSSLLNCDEKSGGGCMEIWVLS